MTVQKKNLKFVKGCNLKKLDAHTCVCLGRGGKYLCYPIVVALRVLSIVFKNEMLLCSICPKLGIMQSSRKPHFVDSKFLVPIILQEMFRMKFYCGTGQCKLGMFVSTHVAAQYISILPCLVCLYSKHLLKIVLKYNFLPFSIMVTVLTVYFIICFNKCSFRWNFSVHIFF